MAFGKHLTNYHFFSRDSFKLYDVYNPGFKNGGKMNITEKGFFNGNELSITLTQPKIARRSNLNRLKLEGGVVATHVHDHQTFEQYLNSQSFVKFKIDKFNGNSSNDFQFSGDDNRQIDAQHRMSYRIFKILQDKFNFT